MPAADIQALSILERRVLWLAAWTIHHANHIRPADDTDVKVGGHQASCASMTTPRLAGPPRQQAPPRSRLRRFPGGPGRELPQCLD